MSGQRLDELVSAETLEAIGGRFRFDYGDVTRHCVWAINRPPQASGEGTFFLTLDIVEGKGGEEDRVSVSVSLKDRKDRPGQMLRVGSRKALFRAVRMEAVDTAALQLWQRAGGTE